jgi:RepB DNA-primase from phage plasmid
MGDTTAAQRMLETFARCGAESFFITKTELEWPGHKKAIWGKTYSLDELRAKLPAMVRTAANHRPVTLPDGKTTLAGENLIMRPIGRNTAFIQLDDLAPEQLNRVRDAACIIHATSPGNYQAWIAVSGAPEGKEGFKEFTRRVREKVGGNDKSASHATRVTGTENFKLKYPPNYPTVTIVETYPGRLMTPEQLEALGLLSRKPEPEKATELQFTRRARNRSGREGQWPSYEESLSRSGPKHSGPGPDRSTADFWWCYFALREGFSQKETEAQLLEESECARERVRGGDKGYPRVTVKNAASRLEYNRQRSRA